MFFAFGQTAWDWRVLQLLNTRYQMYEAQIDMMDENLLKKNL